MRCAARRSTRRTSSHHHDLSTVLGLELPGHAPTSSGGFLERHRSAAFTLMLVLTTAGSVATAQTSATVASAPASAPASDAKPAADSTPKAAAVDSTPKWFETITANAFAEFGY